MFGDPVSSRLEKPKKGVPMKGDRAGYITIIVALTVTLLGLVGFRYYAARFVPVPVKVHEQPIPRAAPRTGTVKALFAELTGTFKRDKDTQTVVDAAKDVKR